MKKPYRYFRSELNGFYLRALAVMSNIAAEDITEEFLYQTLFQWKLEGDENENENENENAIREEDIYNIAIIAGFFQLRVFGQTNIGSISSSVSHKAGGIERSERGLFDMQHEYMQYVRTLKDDYPNDIVNEANINFRMSVVPDGTRPVGYVRYDTPAYDAEGNIILDNILSEPPADGAPYTPYYGEKFLTAENCFNRDTFLDLATFKRLFECLQRVEYNGASVASFLEITRMIGEGYIYEIEISPEGNYYTVNYHLNKPLDISNKIGRHSAWQYICNQRFKLFRLRELED